MGRCIDTVLADVHNAATTALGLTAASTLGGDSLAIRAFDAPAKARLVSIGLQGSGTRTIRITSPRMHDNVTGITAILAESPAEFTMPLEVGEPMYSADQLAVSMDAAASSDTVATLLQYYDDIEGIDANLMTWAQVKQSMIRTKYMQVACTTSATIGQWSDTVITTTENQLKADYRYALLGFETSAVLLTMGLKGPATGNLRVCCPGASSTLDITEYFIVMGERHGLPMIPVFKANDRASTYISTAANTASQAANVVAVLAQLK